MHEMKHPLATVAMVTCNSAPYIREAIESVLAQDFANFELLVCDDCSTDETCDIVSGFHDPRIRVVRNERNVGEYPNRNQAIAMARGRYLMFLDGDDVLYPHGLGYMVRMLESYPAAGFAAARPPSEHFNYPLELSPREFFRCQFLGTNATGDNFTQLAFRTRCLRAAGLFDREVRTGDTHVQLRIAMTESCLLVADGIAWWRRRPGQASEAAHHGLASLAEYVRYSRELLADEECPLPEDERRIARGNLCRHLLRNAARFARRGEPRHAARLVRSAGLSLGELPYLFARDRRPYLTLRDGRYAHSPAALSGLPVSPPPLRR